MECEPNIEKISAFLDGELAPEETEEMEKHLEICEVCRIKFENFKRLSCAAGTAFRQAPDDAFFARMKQDIITKTRSRAKPSRSYVRAFMAAAAVMLFLVTAVVFLPEGGVTPDTNVPAEITEAEEVEVEQFSLERQLAEVEEPFQEDGEEHITDIEDFSLEKELFSALGEDDEVQIASGY